MKDFAMKWLGFIRLLNFEIRRFRWMLIGLMAITAVFQIGSLVITLLGKVEERKQALRQLSGAAPQEEMPRWFAFSFADVVRNEMLRWFALPILIGIAVIGLYIFFIWYREWFGRDTFIYRLLTLHQPRFCLYLAKGCAIVLFVFSLVAFQIVLIPLERWLFDVIVPEEMKLPSGFSAAVRAHLAWQILIPEAADQFAFSYGVGIISVMVMFTAILLERSFRGIGIVYGVGYAAVCAAAMSLPMEVLQLHSQDAYLYPGEIWAIELAMCAVVAIVSLGLGYWLLNKKITV